MEGGSKRRSLKEIVATQVATGFGVKSTYCRGPEKGTEALLKAAYATEDLLINGPLNVASVVETTTDMLCCKYTEDFESIAVGFTDGMVRLFKSDTMALVQTLSDVETQASLSPVTSVKHRPVSKNYPVTNTVTCTYASGCVKCWHYNFSQCLYTIREKRQTLGLVYHPRLPKFVTYGDDSKVYLYDEETRTQERILGASETPGSADGHVSRIFTACFNPQSNHEFITGGWDDMIYFWDLRQAHASRYISGMHVCGDGLDISAKGTEILASGWQRENPLQLYDYSSGKLIATIESDEHQSMLYCGRYLNRIYAAAGGSDIHLLRLVDMRNYTTACCVTGLQGGVYCIDIGPFRKVVKKQAADAQVSKAQELQSVPRLAICSGKKVYQVDFG